MTLEIIYKRPRIIHSVHEN